MAKVKENKPLFIVRPAGVSSDEEFTSDEEGFSFSEPVRYNKPKIEFPKPIEIIETPPLNDSDHIRIEASAGNVIALKALFEKSNLAVDVISQECTPLMYAASNCEYDVMDYLLRRGADPNFNQRGYTVLMSACACIKKYQEEQVKCVQLLMEYGSNVNARQSNGVTPLMLACKEGREMVVAELINAEANINEQDCMGWTPLIWTIHHDTPGQLKTIRVLLNAGVDTSIKCGREQTAHTHALNLGYNHIAVEIPVGGIDGVPLLSDIPSKTDSWEDLRQNLEDTGKNRWSLWKDVARCLHCLGLLYRYSLNFRNNDVDFVKFLTLTEDEMEALSIIPLHRKRLLDMIRKLHLKRWSEKSLGVRNIKSLKENYNMVDEIKLIANVARHITLVHASIAYIRLHMDSVCKEEDNGFKAEELKFNVDTALTKAKILHSGLKSYLNYVKMNVGDHKLPPDWIQPNARRNHYHKTLTVVILVVGVFVIAAWKHRW